MEGRQRQRVGKAGREGQVPESAPGLGNFRPQPLDDFARVDHAVEEAAHLGRADAGEIVADAHVEHRLAQARADARGLQHLDQHRALDVFLERLSDRQLLRPFDVVADRLHVDARPRHFDVVFDLDGLALDRPAARQPGQRDVLRHLGVRSGGRSKRGRGAAVVDGDGKIAPRIGFDEPLGGQIERRSLPLQLAEHSADQDFKRNGSELDHGELPQGLERERQTPSAYRLAQTRRRVLTPIKCPFGGLAFRRSRPVRPRKTPPRPIGRRAARPARRRARPRRSPKLEWRCGRARGSAPARSRPHRRRPRRRRSRASP